MENPNIPQLELEISSVYTSFLKDYYKSQDYESYQEKLTEFHTLSPLKILEEISKHLSIYAKLKSMDSGNLDIIDHYEKTISELKKDIRFHVDLENQLKKGIEYTEAKLKTVENNRFRHENDTIEIIENLKSDNQTLNDLIQIRNLECLDLKKIIASESAASLNKEKKHKIKLNENPKLILEINNLKNLLKNDTKLIENLRKKIDKLKNKKNQLKLRLKEKEEELNDLFEKSTADPKYLEFDSRNYQTSHQSLINYFKSKFEEKCLEVIHLEKRLKPLLHFEIHERLNEKFTNLKPVYKPRYSLSPGKLDLSKKFSKKNSSDFSTNSTPGLKFHSKASSLSIPISITQRP
ncbi:unnamed protein product [Blepharisma stoltei]|uniref:Uncharacterized protein n=1 Tax=Blepharisma stoltei TaxID=1481888 RepID=A0AAU9JN89_9CILI|nr:unnamed protein product [Blepharisma stoltei]